MIGSDVCAVDRRARGRFEWLEDVGQRDSGASSTARAHQLAFEDLPILRHLAGHGPEARYLGDSM